MSGAETEPKVAAVAPRAPKVANGLDEMNVLSKDGFVPGDMLVEFRVAEMETRVTIFNGNHAGDSFTHLPNENILKVAAIISTQLLKGGTDVEGDPDYDDLANKVVEQSHIITADDGSVQVFAGMENKLEDFSTATPEGVAMLIRYIEANNLQEVAPWACPYNLYRCIIALGRRQ